ncbi:PREDICTED: glutathione S-transferase T3-like [Brassica oleracea var. oleracea]|uniref:glutathione S-transferase T3-like n=1 Tax=Brassica oleracea var. oleracea TaxID=109376 RepID=UPI0006A6EA7D|nr:PREDICTED: glutathione S-transferase T3-like [Brassica oleracea var. oleracea]
MDSYPYRQNPKFVDLLNSQQDIGFGSYEDSVELSSTQVPFLATQGTADSAFDGDTLAGHRERRTWTPADDVVLISSWLNTSKDPVVSTEQKSGAFWTRIVAYFAASYQDGGSEQRGASHCKHRWQKINDLVCKFCGAYEAARREKTSGQNENNVLKLAHQIFFNNHKKKFLLEHAWKELRHDQKWCELSRRKEPLKRKAEDGGDSSTSQADSKKRPPGVKASKASGKKTFDPDKQVEEFERIWKIKQKEIDAKEHLSKMSLLDSLIGKKEPLLEYEESLKKKLINGLF